VVVVGEAGSPKLCAFDGTYGATVAAGSVGVGSVAGGAGAG